MLKKLFDLFIFTSLFIAVCALLMVHQTALLFSVELPEAMYAFVFFGSVCSYNFHWYLTPPDIGETSPKLRWNVSNRSLHLLLFIIGLAGAALSSFLLIMHWEWLLLTAFVTFMYSAPKIGVPPFVQLRKIAIGKTIFLAFAWAHITSLLPVLVTINNLQPQHGWFVINRFIFIYAICIVFDRRDLQKDREAGIKSLITILTHKGIDRLFWASLFITWLTSVILLKWFTAGDVLILTIPSLIMGLLYNRCKQNRSDYLYYFLLDGLMALSSAILILAKFAR